MIDIHDYLKDLVLTKNKEYACFYSLEKTDENTNNNYICYFSDDFNYENNSLSYENAEIYKISISDVNGLSSSYEISSNSSVSSNGIIYSNVVGIADIKDVNLIRNDLSSIAISPLYLSSVLFALVMPILVGFIHHFFKIGGED